MTSLEIEKAYVGNTQVEKIYLGADAIYEGTPPGPDYSQMYFTIEALSSGTLNYVKEKDTVPDVVLDYSLDGVNWTTFTSSTASTQIAQVQAGDKVMFKGTNNYFGDGNAYGNTFSGSTALFKVYGNAMSLLYGDGFSAVTAFDTGYSRHLCAIFASTTALTDASNLSLPVLDLTGAAECYRGMFYGCSSLTGAPALPATTLYNLCYQAMFNGCSSLTVAPELPATTTIRACYKQMFYNCTSLTATPLLPAETVAANIMIEQSGAYYRMFWGCSNLSTVTCFATTIQSTKNSGKATTGWLSGVAASGTFYKNPNMTNWSSGADGIPTGWTVVDYTP